MLAKTSRRSSAYAAWPTSTAINNEEPHNECADEKIDTTRSGHRPADDHAADAAALQPAGGLHPVDHLGTEAEWHQQRLQSRLLRRGSRDGEDHRGYRHA